MAVSNETPIVLSLDNAEYPDEENLDSISAESFVPQVQEKEKSNVPQASCSGLHLNSKKKPTPKSKGKPAINSFLPWKLLLPKRGISKIIFMVVASTEKQTGISLQALKKSVAATGYDLEKRKNNFKRVLRALLAKGLLRKLTGRGLTGSYAISRLMLRVLRRRKKKRRRRRMRKSMALSVKKKRVSKRRKRRTKTQPVTDCSQKAQEI
ncbi:spermatid-specific linker histone H1-like protein [Eublepharis macularius]|uniref:Spermatid-specific linker histone H1-like protein n=1 Tax=Eublepharis macularius TaxID=481883 RepID=A0AA97K5T6_EUBMA|nr:spermatid-specific linker histone H1-like protein [Eublepharis macularius]